jgi:hypothetical protein
MWTTRIALLIGCLGVLTLLVNIAAAIGPTYSILGGSLIAVGVATYLIRERVYRRRYPKSAAFEVYMEFGPQMDIPRDKRLTKLFPRQSHDEILVWIEDFKSVDQEIWRLAEEGGNTARSHEEIVSTLKARFPFLEPSALNAASARIDYYVWHEGYALPKGERKQTIL